MDEEITRLFAVTRDLPLWEGVDLSDINASNCDGDNALHLAVGYGDLSVTRALIDAGIDINKAGDLGYTPLHVASSRGKLDMVKLLIENGADMFALNDGYPPFALARLMGHDHICDFLAPLMKQADP